MPYFESQQVIQNLPKFQTEPIPVHLANPPDPLCHAKPLRPRRPRKAGPLGPLAPVARPEPSSWSEVLQQMAPEVAVICCD